MIFFIKNVIYLVFIDNVLKFIVWSSNVFRRVYDLRCMWMYIKMYFVYRYYWIIYYVFDLVL